MPVFGFFKVLIFYGAPLWIGLVLRAVPSAAADAVGDGLITAYLAILIPILSELCSLFGL